MNFLWDIALRAKEQGIKEEDMFLGQAQEYSPFFEQSFSCVNETKVKSGRIELNLFYRFADIFQDILMPESLGLLEGEYAIFCRYFIDVSLHVLLYTDLRNGLTKREIYIRKIKQELMEGTFWSGISEDFKNIEEGKQNRLAALVLGQIETGSSLGMFRRALLILYPYAMLYQIKNEGKKLLLFISREKTEKEEGSLRFVENMFLPVGYELRVFWQYHFGIIGIESTMKPDETALY